MVKTSTSSASETQAQNANQPTRPFNLLILSAGTGGHVYPALAVGEYAQSKGWHVSWIGTNAGIESYLVPTTSIRFNVIKASGLRGKGIYQKVKNIFNNFVAVWQAWRLIGLLQPDVILGMGGYVSGPAGLAARLRGKALIIHEQNAVAGITNQLLIPFSSQVLQAFKGSFIAPSWLCNHPKLMAFLHRKLSVKGLITTGNPIRQDVIAIPQSANKESHLMDEKPVQILVVGGSQGALFINQLMPQVIKLIHKEEVNIKVKHQTGKAHLSATQTAYGSVSEVELIDYIDDISQAYAWADLVVCRSGALTVSELAAAGKASILIPFPYAVDDHQTANGNILQACGASIVMPEADLTPEKLKDTLLPLMQDTESRLKMGQAALDVATPNATRVIFQQCEKACNAQINE